MLWVGPLVTREGVVLVDKVEQKSGESCRVRIHLNVAKRATEKASQSYAAGVWDIQQGHNSQPL